MSEQIGEQGAEHQPRHAQLGLADAQVLGALRSMLLSRALDDRLWLLGRQGKAHFVITPAGHEATQLGCALALRVGHDYVVPYYRDMTLALAMGQTPFELLLHAFGKQGDPASGGRQMFGHFSSSRLRLVSGSSSVGSQLVHAAGLALAQKLRGNRDVVVLSLFGEGATAEGAWHEAMTFAGIHKLGVVFVCENNSYAISVPQAREVPVPDVATKAAGYGMRGLVVDGNDLFAVFEAAQQAFTQARNGAGPCLIECKTYRLRPHSNADDDRKYRSADEVAAWQARDPIRQLERYVLEQELASQQQVTALRAEAQRLIDEATEAAERAADPAPDSLYDHLYADN